MNGSSSACEPQLLVPNFCIAETFAVFEKYRWGARWNPHVSGKARLTPAAFQEARSAFQRAIHNGRKLLQVELSRYHVLCLDLISPINAAYRIKRDRGRKKNVSPAKTYDLLFVAMGIWLQKQLGSKDFVMATGDERVALIVRRATSVNLAEPMREHLAAAARGIGLRYGPSIYPQAVDLVNAKPAELDLAFPKWSPRWTA